MRFLLIILLVLLSLPYSFAEETENSAETEKITTSKADKSSELVSPIGAMVRSFIFPGWGQFHSRGYFRGSLTLLGIGSSAVGAVFAQRSFQNRYNDYATLANLDPDNEEAVLEKYNHANQRYKLRMFFIYAGLGVWAYSIIDSYVGANFYNATTQIRSIQQDAQQIEKLGIQIGATPSHLYLGIVKTF